MKPKSTSIPNIQIPTSKTQHPILNTQHPTPNIQNPTLNTQNPAPNTQESTPNNRHQNTQHSTLNTKHPTFNAQHTTPKTRHFPLSSKSRKKMSYQQSPFSCSETDNSIRIMAVLKSVNRNNYLLITVDLMGKKIVPKYRFIIFSNYGV